MRDNPNKDSLPKIIIIISAQRHGTTTLCNKFNGIESCISFFEAFNKGGIFYQETPSKVETDQYMIKIFKEKNLNKKHTVVFKIFQGHKVKIEDILKLKTDISFIFLKRNPKLSYKSWVKAMGTGNWGTTPPLQEKWNKEGFKGKIISFEKYKRRRNKWFKINLKLIKEYNLDLHTLYFKEIISNDFNPKKFIK